MITEDVEIGIKITPTIYLTLPDEIGVAPFNVDNIIKIESTDEGTIVTVAETEGPFSSRTATFEYRVMNSYEKVNSAINDALMYKEEALKRINELLD